MSGRGLQFTLVFISLSLHLIAPAARATFHTWQINEIYSNADGTVQFIELIEGAGFDNQHLLSGHTFDTNANSFPYAGNLPSSSTAGKFFLMATSGFGELPGGVTPDYTIPANFFAIAGDLLDFAGVDSVSYISGQLPTDGVQSINRNLVSQTNSPTNFAGNVGSVGSSDPDQVWVDFAYTGTETGTETQPYNTLAEAVAGVAAAGTVFVSPGSTSEVLTISTPLVLSAPGGTVSIGVAARAVASSMAAPGTSGDGPAPERAAIAPAGQDSEDTNIVPWSLSSANTRAVYEAAFPRADGEGVRRAGKQTTLAIRLAAGTALNPESIWTTILPGTVEAEAIWQSAGGDRLDDIWVLVRPLNAWPDRGQIVLAVGGMTSAGQAVEAPAQVFEIVEDAEEQTGDPTFRAAGEDGHEIGPNAVFLRPITLEIPVSPGEGLEYYHRDSNAWYPVEAVAGFLADRPRLVWRSGSSYLEITALHGGQIR